MNPQILDDISKIDQQFNQLKKNFMFHKTKQISFRKQALKDLQKGYRQLQDQISQALKKDLNNSKIVATMTSHGPFYSELKEALNNLNNWTKPQSLPTPILLGLASSSIIYEPLGVVLIISAWNYPISTAIIPLISAIAAGNAAILKPSQMAPHTSKIIKKLFQKYLDPDFYRVIEGKVQVAKAISKLPFDLICFTGSTVTGRLVGIQASKNLTPCILQLGGKCPVIVDNTANLQVAAYRILFGKFLNCGQTCVGVDHLFVHQTVIEKFKTILIEKINQMYTNGENLQQSKAYGKIINQIHVNRLQKLLKDKHEGEIIYGGQINKQKQFIQPTIIIEPKSDSLMMKEEIFGPILPIFGFNSLSLITDKINQQAKPLVVYVFSEDSKNIQMLKQRTSSGAFVVNDAVVQNGSLHLPFGGVGGSGYGRYHGVYGFKNFSNMKSICETKATNMFPNGQRFPPYTQSRQKTLKKLMKYGDITYGEIGKCCAIFWLITLLIGAGIALALIYV